MKRFASSLIASAVASLALVAGAFSTAARAVGDTLHTLLFRHMARNGLIAFAVDSAEISKEVEAGLKGLKDEVKSWGEKALSESAKAGTVSAETKAAVDKAMFELNAKRAEDTAVIAELAQKVDAMRSGSGGAQRKSIGREIMEAPEMVELLKKGSEFRGRVNIAVKAITSLAASAGDAVAPDFRPAIMGLPFRRMRVRDLMLPGRTSSNAVTYVKQTGYTNNAAPVSETIKKPESTIVLDAVTQSVITLAHFMKAAKQILDDVPQLESFIEGQLRYGLEYVEEVQLLKGSGVGLNLNGIYTQATAYSAPIAAPGTPNPRIDILRLAMLQVELAEFPATGIVLHPSDWAAIELTKDLEGRYVIGDPQGTVQPRLWGLPVVPTQAMTVDTFLVGAFRPFSQIFDREDANVVIATENEDDFVKNLISIRGEERLASAVYRSEAFVKGDITP